MESDSFRNSEDKQPTTQESSPLISKPKTTKHNRRTLLIVGTIVLAIGIAAAVYFFIIKPSQINPLTRVDTSYVSTAKAPTGMDIVNGYLEDMGFKDKTPKEVFDELMPNVDSLLVEGEYDEAIKILNIINSNLDTLSNYEVFQVYNSYATAYLKIGEEGEAERFQKIANAILNPESADFEEEE